MTQQSPVFSSVDDTRSLHGFLLGPDFATMLCVAGLEIINDDVIVEVRDCTHFPRTRTYRCACHLSTVLVNFTSRIKSQSNSIFGVHV
jgi:hypothetical protein